MLCHLDVLPGPFTAFPVVCQGSLGKSQGTVYMYNAEEQAAKPRLTPKPSLPFLSYNTDTADLIVETNAL